MHERGRIIPLTNFGGGVRMDGTILVRYVFGYAQGTHCFTTAGNDQNRLAIALNNVGLMITKL